MEQNSISEFAVGVGFASFSVNRNDPFFPFYDNAVATPEQVKAAIDTFAAQGVTSLKMVELMIWFTSFTRVGLGPDSAVKHTLAVYKAEVEYETLESKLFPSP